MFGKKEELIKYENLLNEFQKIEDKIPYFMQELDSITVIDDNDRFEKRTATTLLCLAIEPELRRAFKKAKNQYSALRRPFGGLLLTLYREYEKEDLIDLQNTLEWCKKGLEKFVEKYLARHRQQLQLPLL